MSQNNGHDILIEARNLKKHYPIRQGALRRQVGAVQAVDGVSFAIRRGETLALVGESGSGKTTVGRMLLNLIKPTSGEILFGGQNLTWMNDREARKMRRQMQLIFQDPYAALNPRMTVGQILSEPLEVHNVGDSARRKERVRELLNLVGLNTYYAQRYPHEFSGGQRQRIGIARALATEPRFIVADEPVSALDASVQAQVANLLDGLRRERGLACLFISPDIGAVRSISDRVAVMYLGRIVEMGERDAIYEQPLHPYTQALLSAIPVPDPDREEERQRLILEGDAPNPAQPPPGCRFHPRCRHVTAECRHTDPLPRNLGSANQGHWVACHHAEKFL